MIVDIFIPCFIDQFYPQTALNMVQLLERAGCGVSYNPEQTCCGQPAFNAGRVDDCKAIGEKFIREFTNDRYIVTPSASCVGMVKNYYPEVFRNSASYNQYKLIHKNIIEFSDFMVNVLRVTELGAKLEAKAVYHDSCAALRELNLKNEARILLSKVRGLKLREMKEQDVCCGFGGTFSTKHPAIASSMAEQKINNALQEDAEIIISTDLSCLMHIQSYASKQAKPVKSMHLIDVLASS